jgi:hypothetical protein
MEIKNFNVKELSKNEMLQINGGSKIGDALKAAWDAICCAVAWVAVKIEEWYFEKRQEYINGAKDEV